MQIKLILAAVATFACLSGGIFSLQALAEDSKFGEEGMSKNSKRDINVAVRNTRPMADHHKDARACLDKGKNETIIKCANKYH
jgi:hypothetical protein